MMQRCSRVIPSLVRGGYARGMGGHSIAAAAVQHPSSDASHARNMVTNQPTKDKKKDSFNVLADMMIVPLGDNGTGASVSKYVASAIQVLRETPGLKAVTHGNGTNLEGDYDIVMDAIKRAHLKLHGMGVVHTHMTLKLGTRLDKDDYSLEYKVGRVEEQLKGDSGA